MEEIQITHRDWRSRALVFLNAKIKEEIINLSNCTLRIFEYDDNEYGGNHIIEAYSSREMFPEIENAHYFALDNINRILDKFSLISYFPAIVIKELSTTWFKTEIGEIFELLIPNEYYGEKKPIIIQQKDIETIKDDVDNKYLEVIRFIREGLCSNNIETQFLNYYYAIERVAEINTTKKIIRKCEQCGFEKEEGLATSNFMRETFKKYGIDNKDYKRIRELRGKISHGSGKRDNLFYKELRVGLIKIESLAIDLVSTKMNINVKSPVRVHLSHQFWNLKGKKIKDINEKIPAIFNIVECSYSFSAGFPKPIENFVKDPSDNKFELDGSLTPEVPSDRHLDIHKECWPY